MSDEHTQARSSMTDLSSLKPGDLVTLIWWNGHRGLSERRNRRTVSVERVTPKQIILGHFSCGTRVRFWRESGRHVGDLRGVSGGYTVEFVKDGEE